ncbi:MAG: 30S ribosomal protein S9 [Pseudomonadota bacterium]
MSLTELHSQLKASTEVRKQNIDKLGRAYGTGRRKDAVARVWIKAGKGKVTINGREIKDYFTRPLHIQALMQPFVETKTSGQFDIMCTVKGGGLTGQAGAIRHGLSRALDQFSPELHTLLSRAGFLTRDSRTVERKKYGQKKARKRFQFSKR